MTVVCLRTELEDHLRTMKQERDVLQFQLRKIEENIRGAMAFVERVKYRRETCPYCRGVGGKATAGCASNNSVAFCPHCEE